MNTQKIAELASAKEKIENLLEQALKQVFDDISSGHSAFLMACRVATQVRHISQEICEDVLKKEMMTGGDNVL